MRERLKLNDDRPSPPGANSVPGKDGKGRFAKGNKLGRGNPLAKQAQALRVALMGAVSTDDLALLIERLLKQAIQGNVVAAKVVLDRLLGPPQPIDILERLEALEARMGNKP